MTQADWALEPVSHPELLGEDLEGLLPDDAPPRNPEFAGRRYREAEQAFTAVGATRGVAAVALRLARLAAIGNDWATATRELDRCRALAEGVGDGALVQLAGVHRALAGIVVGVPVPAAAVGDDVAGWASTVGSRSYARGLGRLCHAKARRWRPRDVQRARRAVLLAEAINDRLGTVSEPELVRAEVAEQYGAANYRRAALVLTLLDLDAAERSPAATADELTRVRLINLAMTANRDANALKDPEGITQACTHLSRLAGLSTGSGSGAGAGAGSAFDPDGGAPNSAQLMEMLDALGPDESLSGMSLLSRMVAQSTAANASVMIPLYRGVEARAQGDLPGADRLFLTAYDAASALGPAAGMLPAVVLGTMNRNAEALALLEPLVASGELAPDLAASFFTRLKEYDRALTVIDQVTFSGDAPPRWKSWEWSGLRAEALAGAGRPDAALPLAERAIERFEQHLAGLARDVLRTMATDDLTVAGLYTTAIRARADLHERSAADASAHLAAAFRLSDRCRGSVLSDLIALEQAHPHPAAGAAVRAWLRAGAELARTIEGLGTDLAAAIAAPPEETRRTVRSAERRLDDSEAELAVVAPAAFAGRKRLPDSPTLAAVQERLQPGTLLLQFHAYDDQLIGWAVTRDSARMERRSSSTPMLTAHTRRFIRAVADPGSTIDERCAAAEPLLELLRPFAAELADHRRLVIVPHGPLAGLPFHVLPLDGGDLASTHVVSYLPAASAAPAAGAPARQVGRGATTLVLGNPAYAPARGLRALPGAAVEATTIGRRRNTKVLDADADRETVLRGLSAARVVHLATHGLLHEAAPYSAELALAGEASLTVPDLMGLETTIDLAVLSACDSGRGRATAAGDVIGLTRALMAAGAGELVVSLWPVDDQLACLTMVRFHEQLLELEDRTPAEALAGATTAVRAISRADADTEYARLRDAAGGGAPGGVRSARDIVPQGAKAGTDDPSHPYFWAPYVHIGL
jgi:CHAT domain-containing protein